MATSGLRVALLSLLALGCVVPRPVPRAQISGWYGLRAGGFRLIGDAPPEELARLAGELVVFESTFALLSRARAEPGAPPVPIYAFEDRELARRFGLGRGVAGWMLPTLEGCFATVQVRANHAETRRTLFHEYTHTLLQRNRRAPLPPWYDEGLSTYFGTLSLRDGVAVVGAVPAGALARVAGARPYPLDRLFAAAVWRLPGREIGDFYATSWALSHYLLASPRGRRELASFAAALEGGVPWREGFAAAFARSPDQLEAELEAHVAALARGVPAEALVDPGAASLAPLEPIPLASGEVAYELGYLTLQLASEAESDALAALAQAFLETALAEDPASARSEAALAEALALDGDLEEARPHAEAARARAPDDARIWLHAGRLELSRAESAPEGSPESATALAAAAEAYQRALALDPRSAVAWFGLGRSWRHSGRPEEAVGAFERARGLGWSAALDLELGGLHLERGRRDAALRLLWPLAQDPHRGDASEDAMALLEEAGLLPDEPGRDGPAP
jgi:tetratricopeptide (TPR) repeat protein